jgi:hypothetical protein
MTFMKKSDVKKHLSSRVHNRIHISPPDMPDAVIPDATQAAVDAVQAEFTKDFTADHQRTLAVVVPFPEAADRSQTQPSPSFGPAKL